MPETPIGAGQIIRTEEDANRIVLAGLNAASDSIRGIVNEMANMEAHIPSFWLGDAASAFTRSVGTWLEGAHQLQAGLRSITATMEDANSKQLNTEHVNLSTANANTAIHY